MNYERLIYKIGSLYSELCEIHGAYDGEHTINFVGRDGKARLIKVHIDGDSIEFIGISGDSTLTGALEVRQDE